MLGLEPRALCGVYARISILPTNLQQENKALAISVTAQPGPGNGLRSRALGLSQHPCLHTVDAQKVSIHDVWAAGVKGVGHNYRLMSYSRR